MKKRAPPQLESIKSRAALRAIWLALEGDSSWLASRLRKGIASNVEQALAADLIEKRIKIRRSEYGMQKRYEIAQTADAFGKLMTEAQRKAVIHEVIQAFGGDISERHVYDVMAEFDEATLSRIQEIMKIPQESEDCLDRDTLVQIAKRFLART